MENLMDLIQALSICDFQRQNLNYIELPEDRSLESRALMCPAYTTYNMEGFLLR
jgi:hypothetical protein